MTARAQSHHLPLERLADGHALNVPGLAAVHVADGVEQGGKAGGVHGWAAYPRVEATPAGTSNLITAAARAAAAASAARDNLASR